MHARRIGVAAREQPAAQSLAKKKGPGKAMPGLSILIEQTELRSTPLRQQRGEICRADGAVEVEIGRACSGRDRAIAPRRQQLCEIRGSDVTVVIQVGTRAG